MSNVMETSGTKLIASFALVLLFVAVSAVAQSPAPTAAAPPPASAGTSAGQEQRPAGDDSVPTIRTGANEVNVVFTVTDKHGKRIIDLKQGDFRVLDDNKPPQEIRSFHAETNLPLQVGLLIDASNSVRDRFKFEQESAIEFLNQTIHPRIDQAFVVGFDVTPEVTQDFTDNTESLCLPRQAAEGAQVGHGAARHHSAQRRRG